MNCKKIMLMFAFLMVFLVSSVSATDYPYWIEHDESNNPVNDVWIKLNLSASSTKTIYAFKKEGYSPDGDSVFEFFDDFMYDKGWTLWGTNSNKQYSISNSILTLPDPNSNTGGEDEAVYYPTTISTNTIISMRMRIYKTTNTGLTGFRFSEEDPPSTVGLTFGGLNDGTFGVTNWISNLLSFSLNSNYHNWEIKKVSNNYYLYVDDAYKGYVSHPNTLSNYLNFGVPYNYNALYADWIFIRKYTANEPTVTITDMGTYYKIDITNNEATDLTNYQVAIPISSLDITSITESIEFTDTSPFEVGLNQNVSYDEFKVGYNVTHSCYWNNASENVTEVNLTLVAININDSTTLYNQTFTNVSENQTVSYTYTLQISDAHDSITFKCIYKDDLGFNETLEINKTVENSIPTNPDLSVEGDFLVNTTMTATAENSTDADGDSLTYEYKFYNVNDDTELQSWSTDNTYLIQQSDAHDSIRIYAKVYDNYNGSSETNTLEYVRDSAPTITYVRPLQNVSSRGNQLCFEWNATDIDGDTIYYDAQFEAIPFWFYSDGGNTFTVRNTNVTLYLSNYDSLSYVENHIPIMILQSNSNLSNTNSCIIINDLFDWESELGITHFDLWIRLNLTATDNQNINNDGQLSDNRNSYPINNSDLGDDPLNITDRNVTYLYSFNYSFLFYDELTKTAWDLNTSNIDLTIIDVYRGSNYFYSLEGSGNTYEFKNNIVMSPKNSITFSFDPEGSKASNYAGVRKFNPYVNFGVFTGEIPVYLLYPQNSSAIVSPELKYDDGSLITSYAVYIYINGEAKLISSETMNPKIVEYPRIPLVYNRLYYWIIDGKVKGFVSALSNDEIVFSRELSYPIIQFNRLPILFNYTPQIIYNEENNTMYFTFVDAENQYDYWGIQIELVNGSIINDYKPRSEQSMNITFFLNESALGRKAKFYLVLFNDVPTIDENGAFDNYVAKKEFKIFISTVHFTSPFDALSNLTSYFADNLLLGYMMYIVGIILVIILLSYFGASLFVYSLSIWFTSYLFYLAGVLSLPVFAVLSLIFVLLIFILIGV